MAKIDCRIEIAKLFPKLPQEIREAFVREAEEIQRGAKSIDDFKGKFRDRMKEFKGELLSEWKKQAINRQKRYEIYTFVSQFGDNPVEGFRSYLAGGWSEKNGIRHNVGSLSRTIREKFTSHLSAGLDKTLRKIALDGTMDRQVAVAMHALANKLDTTGMPKEALEIAKAYNKVYSDILHNLRRVGLNVNEIKGYLGKQIHDPDEMRKAGFRTWARDIWNTIDHEATFKHGDGTTKAKLKYLRNVYDEIVSGKGSDKAPTDVLSDQWITMVSKRASEQTKVGRHRSLIFKSDGHYDYNIKYGQKTLLGGLMNAIHDSSRRVAVVEKFGHNPDLMFKSMWERMSRDFKAKGNVRAFDQLQAQREEFHTSVEQMRREVFGLNKSVALNTTAKVGEILRAIQNMAKLPFVILSTPTDWAAAASTLRAVDGKDYLGKLVGSFTDFVGSLADPKMKVEVGEHIYIMSNDWLGDTYHRMGVNEIIPQAARKNEWKDVWRMVKEEKAGDAMKGFVDALHGSTLRAQQAFFRYNGLQAFTNGGRFVLGRRVSDLLATMAQTEWGALNKHQQHTLKIYGINQAEWKILQKATEQDGYGRTVMTPEAVENLPDEMFKELKGKKRRNVAFYKTDLSMKLANLIVEHADVGMRILGARKRAQMLWSTPGNSIWGQVLRSFWQFKGFSIATDDVFKRIINAGGGDNRGTAMFIGASIALGAVSMSMKDLKNGKTPKILQDPKDALASLEFYREAAFQSGSMGLYGDMFMNDWDAPNRTVLRGIGGPIIGQLEDVRDVIAEGQKANERGSFTTQKGTFPIGKLGLRMLRNNLPLKPAFDMLILNDIQTQLDPEWEYRQLRKQIKEGQPPLW